MFGVLLGILLCGPVHASSNCAIPQPQLMMPTSITVDDSLPIGSLLAPWSYTTMQINCWKDTYYAWRASHRLYTDLPKSSVTLTDGGINYMVFETGTPGVGVAVGFVSIDHGNAWETLTDQAATNAFDVSRNLIRTVLM
jgi:hypothetical protein